MPDKCTACHGRVILAKNVLTGVMIMLAPDTSTDGTYRLGDGTPPTARKLTPTEKLMTGFGQKLYKLHDCPRAKHTHRRRAA